MGVVCAGTVSGNALVLRALWRATPRTPAHYLLATLASADLLLGLAVQPLSAAIQLYVFRLDRAWCACWSTLDVLCTTASILSLCALVWERHEGVTRPLERARRAARAQVVALLVWPLSAAIALPDAFVPSPRYHLPGEVTRACAVNTNIGYVLFSVTFSFYLPAAAMLLLYCRVIRALRALPPLRAHRGGLRSPPCPPPPSSGNYAVWLSSFKNRSPTPGNNEDFDPDIFLSPKGNHLGAPSSVSPRDMLSSSLRSTSPILGEHADDRDTHTQRRQARATRTIVLLMALFLLCWTPFFVVLPLDAVFESVSRSTLWCVTWLGYANSAVNPLVYAASSPAVRRALHSTLTFTSGSGSGSSLRSSELQLTAPAVTTHHLPSPSYAVTSHSLTNSAPCLMCRVTLAFPSSVVEVLQ